jgi:predicted nucleic acid-binding protein
MARSSVYDTRFFFEYFYSPDTTTTQSLKRNLQNTGEKLVSAISIHELHRLNLKKLDHDTAKLRGTLIAHEFKVVDVDYELAISGAELSNKYRIPLADSIIAATALRAECPLVSDDVHFRDIQDLKLIWPIT